MSENEKNTTDKTEIFETMLISSAVRTMALPMVISQIIVLVYNMADTFYLGRTNDPLMVASVSMILPAFNLTLSLAGINIPMLFLLSSLFGIYGLVWSQLVSDILMATISYIVYYFYRKKI